MRFAGPSYKPVHCSIDRPLVTECRDCNQGRKPRPNQRNQPGIPKSRPISITNLHPQTNQPSPTVRKLKTSIPCNTTSVHYSACWMSIQEARSVQAGGWVTKGEPGKPVHCSGGAAATRPQTPAQSAQSTWDPKSRPISTTELRPQPPPQNPPSISVTSTWLRPTHRAPV